MAIEIRGMAPLLQVFDMPASIVFYRDVLGFQVKSTSSPGKERFDWALLTLNGVELMLNTAYEEDARPPAPDPARVAAHEDTAIYVGARMWMRRTYTFAHTALPLKSRRSRTMA